ncbi:MAG TPA: RagB/SusD family nutrient uptake outer membrane protein [Prolixibacteraceae bacterium]|nr:RagB/SusD family nutrient uptake outer membrane protein [Prolixibacteraceae bacterium]
MRKFGILAAILLFSSCEFIFHEVDNPYLEIDTEQEKIDMLNGVYSRLAKVHNGDYFALLCRSDDVNNFMNYNASGSGNSCGVNLGPIDYPGIIGNSYLNLYTAIININRLLDVVSTNEESALAGELYFLRSYCYFKLVRFFGTPPIILDTEVSYTVEKPTYAEVYAQIEEDMFNALDLLPDTYTDSRIPDETPHKGTAKAMLAEIYLNMAGYPLYDEAKYAEAVRLAKEVIDQSEYYNFHLLDDYALLWSEDNTHNAEYLFGLFFDAETGDRHNSIVTVSGGHSHNMEYMLTTSWYNPEYKFFMDFPDNYRKYTSFTTGTYREVSYGSLDTVVYSLRFVPFDPLVDPCIYLGGASCLKWIYGVYDMDDGGMKMEKTKSTLYLLRYAQVLLTYAEAKARTGGPDAMATELVNRIRRRANNVNVYAPSEFDLPTNLTTEQFIDSVVWERAWELAMEPDTRWFDIIRLDLKDEIDANRYKRDLHTVVPDEYLTEEWYFYQIPQEDRWNNPNFE